MLIHEAIGDQLTCVFVDHGLLRLAEGQKVAALFRDSYNIPLVHVNAEDMFLKALEGVDDPEQKRKTIGKLFIDVFEREAKKIGGAEFLAQGTLYPDVIESVSFTGGPSVTIKSHHNVGGLPERMNMKLVEPLRELFKDEVRALGRELGLPEAFVGRHPFPGPGLAIRVPGAITNEKLDILRLADEIFIEEIRRTGQYDDIWQAFAVLLPVKTVGVMGDFRTYEYVVGLRAVTSTDGMTADFYQFDMKFFGMVATRIINEVKGVNRVVYDVTSASRRGRLSGSERHPARALTAAEGSLQNLHIVMRAGRAQALRMSHALIPVVWATLVFVLAGAVKGVTGMGLPTVAIGLLGLLMPPGRGRCFADRAVADHKHLAVCRGPASLADSPATVADADRNRYRDMGNGRMDCEQRRQRCAHRARHRTHRLRCDRPGEDEVQRAVVA